MTGRELIEALLDYDLDREVFVATDPEGNSIAELTDVAEGVDDDEEFGTGEAAIVLWHT